MCGIVAALPRYDAEIVAPRDGEALLAAALDLDVPSDGGGEARALRDELAAALPPVAALRDELLGAGAVEAVIARPGGLEKAIAHVEQLFSRLAALDEQIDVRSAGWDADDTELVQRGLRQLTDAVHSLWRDRLEVAQRVATWIEGTDALTPRAAANWLALDAVLQAVNKLEVRGRDSAGVSVHIRLSPEDRAPLVVQARSDVLLRNGSARATPDGIVFVYKRAAVIGRLGENVAALLDAMRRDTLLRRAMTAPSARVLVLAHTRWASVGRISEANAHPVDERRLTDDAGPCPVLAVLNGDIDNHLELAARVGYVPDEHAISTDAKVIPLVLHQYLKELPAPAALARALADFRGSMAISAVVGGDELLLAVKGSGQGLYVGTSVAGVMVASEVYGLVATCDRYLRLDGGDWNGCGKDGTVIALSRGADGGVGAWLRLDGDGRTAPVDDAELREPEITTRDLALGGAEHYLAKEISEAASAFRKTLRGRVHVVAGEPEVDLPESSVPAVLRAAFSNGTATEIVLIGQGTAAVACAGIATVMRGLLPRRIVVRDMPATEFSVYGLGTLHGTCVIAVSQSGSTTDTNRAVDLARSRGAHIVSIVNRRDSDLAARSDGVVYTSDGRDVEMAVASTKAFYAQVAAGCLLGLFVARLVEGSDPDRSTSVLRALRALPAQLRDVYASQSAIAAVAERTAARFANWAVVGSGPNRVAASEARIKLSELCYKTVSTDATEDKKHIDLSAESLVLVCTAGAPASQVSDLRKEVEIFRAHKNEAIVIADESTATAWPTPHVIVVPAAHPVLAWILSTAAAHLYAYHAARAIDRRGDELRLALDHLEAGAGDPTNGAWRLRVQDLIVRTLERVEAGELRGVLSPDAALRLALCAIGGTGSALGALQGVQQQAEDPTEFLRAALTEAIDELTRSIDTVKHQAKTVTVGTSRDDADLLENDLVRALRETGIDPEGDLAHAVLHALRAHARLVDAVEGATTYEVGGADLDQLRVMRKVGVAAGLPSRADDWAPLIGSKGLVARTREVRVFRGGRDGRLVIGLPLQAGVALAGVVVVHVRLRERASADDLVACLRLTPGRLDEIAAAVSETDGVFRPESLAELPPEEVLLAPVGELAARLRQR